MATLEQLRSGLERAVAAEDEEAAAILRQRIADAQAEIPSAAESAALGFAAGGTFGFADEIGGAISAGLQGMPEFLGGLSEEEQASLGRAGVETGYGGARDRLREEHAEARQENPWTYGVAEFAGGAAVPGAATYKAAKMLPGAVAAASRLAPAARLAISGTASGALAGTGYSEGETAGEVAVDAAIGAGLGAAISPVAAWGIGKVGQAGQAIGGALKDALYRDPVAQASRRVGGRLRAEGLTPEEAAEQMTALGPEGRLADIGPNLADEAVEAAKRPGAGRTQAVDFVEGRQAGQQTRLAESARETIDPKWKDYHQYIDDLAEARKTQSGPLYEAAYEIPIKPTEQMVRISKTPFFQQAAKDAQENLGNELDLIGPGGVDELGNLSTRFMDQIQRSMRGKIGEAMRAGNGELVRQYSNIRRAFLREIDDQNPTFKEARGVYAGASQLDEAAKMGRDALGSTKTTAGDVRHMMRDFSEGETESFRIGLLQGIIDKVKQSGEGHNAARRLISSTRVKELLGEFFPDENAFARFIKTVDAENAMQVTRNRVMGGSPTAPLLWGAEGAPLAAEVGSFAQTAATHGILPAVAGTLKRVMGRAGNEMSDADYEEISKLLFGKFDADELKAALGRSSRERIRMVPATEGALAAPLGVATGQLGIREQQ